MKEAIHTRLSPNNIDRDNGAEIPVAWMPTIKETSKPTTHEKPANA